MEEKPMMLPGISVTTTPENYGIIRQIPFDRFDGTNRELDGDVVPTASEVRR